MPNKIVIASAGNMLPAALATLRTLGYVVTVANDGQQCRAENARVTLVAEDPLVLLGLVKLYELRGDAWQPTEVEVNAYLSEEDMQDDNK